MQLCKMSGHYYTSYYFVIICYLIKVGIFVSVYNLEEWLFIGDDWHKCESSPDCFFRPIFCVLPRTSCSEKNIKSSEDTTDETSSFVRVGREWS